MKAARVAASRRDDREAARTAMQRYVAGEEAAFGELYALVAPRLFGYLVRRTRDVDEAQDLLQQTLLVVHRARATYICGADVMPWLLAIARRLVIDRARRASREPSGDGAELLELPARGELVDDLIEMRQLVTRVESLLAMLPEPQRRVFDLVKRRGLSLSETAGALKITVGAVKLRIHRAHQSLRAALTGARELP